MIILTILNLPLTCARFNEKGLNVVVSSVVPYCRNYPISYIQTIPHPEKRNIKCSIFEKKLCKFTFL